MPLLSISAFHRILKKAGAERISDEAVAKAQDGELAARDAGAVWRCDREGSRLLYNALKRNRCRAKTRQGADGCVHCSYEEAPEAIARTAELTDDSLQMPVVRRVLLCTVNGYL